MFYFKDQLHSHVLYEGQKNFSASAINDINAEK